MTNPVVEPLIRNMVPATGTEGACEPVLRASGLGKAYGGQRVLDGASLTLHPGEVVLLRGANGSGKTTLLNVLTGNLEPDAGLIELGSGPMKDRFEFPRNWWRRLSPANRFTPERVAHRGVGRTWQDLRLFASQSLLDNIGVATPGQIGENPFRALISPSAVRAQDREIRRAADHALGELGLAERVDSSADRISLGQAKRVTIARAVQAGARILFLDEPLAGLDAGGLGEVMALLRRVSRESGVTLVIVEHVFNIPLVLELADTVWTLRDGRLDVEAPSDVLAEHVGETDEERVRRWSRVLRLDGTVETHRLPKGGLLTTLVPSGATRDEVVMEVTDLVVHRGNRLVIGEELDGSIHGLSFRLFKGCPAILAAPNGWGKTTLLETIAGVGSVTRGIVRLNGIPVDRLPPWTRACAGLSVLQARNHTFPGLSTSECLRLAGTTHLPASLEPLRERLVSSLSGGERQRLAIACAVARPGASALVLDEPFSALDHGGLTELSEAIRKCNPQGLLVLEPATAVHARDPIAFS
jgi:branched-chain amino acid transport system ATP-binding protein